VVRTCRGLADCVPVIRGLVRVSFAAVVGREGVERPSGPASDAVRGHLRAATRLRRDERRGTAPTTLNRY